MAPRTGKLSYAKTGLKELIGCNISPGGSEGAHPGDLAVFGAL